MATSSQFLSISTATERLMLGMHGQLTRPLPVAELKKDRVRVGRDASINWGPWNEKASAAIRNAAINGSLQIYFIPKQDSKSPLTADERLPDLVPVDVLKLIIPSRQGLPDHPTRLAKPEPSKSHFYEWRWRLTGGELLIEKTAFERWYRAEKQKGKWPSQAKREKPKPGRPRAKAIFAHRIANLIEGEKFGLIGAANMESDKEEDEDVDAPPLENLAFLARSLRESSPRKRLKGKKGQALIELANIQERIATGNVPAEERVVLGFRLWQLNGQVQESKPGPLGVGQFAWRPKRRPKGAASSAVNQHLDSELLEQAKTLIAYGGSAGSALRKVIQNAMAAKPEAFGANVELESHIKRLRRKADRLRFFED